MFLGGVKKPSEMTWDKHVISASIKTFFVQEGEFPT